MKINRKIIACLFITFGFIRCAAAHDDDTAILVQFNTKNPTLLDMKSLKLEKYTMNCEGKDNKYYVDQVVPNDLGLNIVVKGPFRGDPRDTCKINILGPDNDDNKVYFTLNSLAISFSYNGVQHLCYIEQNIGTTYKGGLYPYYGILRGGDTEIPLSCKGAFKGDSYIVNPGDKGIDFHPGNITINVSE